jgi:hypothetical protein
VYIAQVSSDKHKHKHKIITVEEDQKKCEILHHIAYLPLSAYLLIIGQLAKSSMDGYHGRLKYFVQLLIIKDTLLDMVAVSR